MVLHIITRVTSADNGDMKMKDSVVFITARANYVVYGLKNDGYTVIRPYKDRTIIGRILREVWFRFHLPERVWYSKTESRDHYIVQDTLITQKYLKWLRKMHPNAKIYFMYVNMVGKAKHVLPNEIPSSISVWTYDSHDAKKYGLNLYEGGYSRSFIGKKKQVRYDVVYVGADKGRGENLLELQREMEELGLKTKFIITADGRLAKKKNYHSKPIPYSKVVELVNESRAVLNIVLPNQTGASLRDFESVFNEVKLITNNQSIKDYAFYKEENVFILGKRPLSELPTFLETPFIPVEDTVKYELTMDKVVESLLNSPCEKGIVGDIE